MASALDHVPPEIAEWIALQPMFFVATAPLSGHGHVNLSPKGLETFRVLDQRTVAWLDVTGSGAETIAHLRENGRVTVMFCAFAGPPRIVRIHGRGTVLLPDGREFAKLQALLPSLPGTRAIIRVHVERVGTSCGYGVPEMALVGQRDTLPKWAGKRTPRELQEFRRKHNTSSIDGLPAYPEPDDGP